MKKQKSRKIIQHNERCKGCLYCSIACPVEAISVSENVNAKGYNTMQIDEDRCTTCGSCYTVCPDFVFEVIEVPQDVV